METGFALLASAGLPGPGLCTRFEPSPPHAHLFSLPLPLLRLCPPSRLYPVFGKLSAGSWRTGSVCLEPDRMGFPSPVSAKDFGREAQGGPRLGSQLTRLLGMWARKPTVLAVTVDLGGVEEGVATEPRMGVV